MLLLLFLIAPALAGARIYYSHPRLYEPALKLNFISILSCSAKVLIDMEKCKFYSLNHNLIKGASTYSPKNEWKVFKNHFAFSVFESDGVSTLYEFWDYLDGNNILCQPYTCPVFGIIYPYYGRAIASCDPKNHSRAMYHLKLNGFFRSNGTFASRNICGMEDLTK